MRPLLLDGPIGSCLAEQGLSLEAPLWSRRPLIHAPEAVLALHTAYASAGADVHTANSFRCQPHLDPETWRDHVRLSVELARKGAQEGARVAGSIAPAEDCYRPDLSPPNAREIHRAVARALAEEGVDLLLCETFGHVEEGLVALEEAVATGLEAWVSFSAGPEAKLLRPEALEEAAWMAAESGASAVLFNCTSASLSIPYVEALSRTQLPFGIYANAGPPEEGFGWTEEDQQGPERYAACAREWLNAGASIVGSCCGTRPAHTALLRDLINARD